MSRPRGRRYAGKGVAEMHATVPSSAMVLPGRNDASVLPDPMAAYEDLRARYVAANGAIPGAGTARPQPRLTVRDAKVIANHLTLALRNDLPSIDAHDAAVIWEKWRRSVAQLREMMRGIGDDDLALAVGLNLGQWTLVIHDDLAEALRDPGKVFQRYCPWRADWATFERVHPEAV